MKLLESISIRGNQPRRIDLCQGDLSELTAEDGVDALLVSAFPDDYTPSRTSLIGAVSRRGLSITQLAADKDIDIRRDFSCWLSKEVPTGLPGLHVKRILCFEPLVRGEPPEVVGDIFRALMPIVTVRPEIHTVALPVVAAGDQGYPFREMFVPLLDAAIHWLDLGLPIDRLVIATYADEASVDALAYFRERKMKYESQAAALQPGPLDYDVFISYSHANTRERELLQAALFEAMPGIRVFVDKQELDVGASWQSSIFESIERSRKVVALFSPEYLASKVCKEEYNTAWICDRDADGSVLFPLYVYSTGLPAYMRFRHYLDCREGNKVGIQDAAKAIVASLDQSRVS